MIIARIQSENQLNDFNSKIQDQKVNEPIIIFLKGDEWLSTGMWKNFPQCTRQYIITNKLKEFILFLKYRLLNRTIHLYYSQYNSLLANILASLCTQVTIVEDGTNALLFEQKKFWKHLITGWEDFRPRIKDRLSLLPQLKFINDIKFDQVHTLRFVGSPCIEKKQVYREDYVNTILSIVRHAKNYNIKLEYFPHRHEEYKDFYKYFDCVHEPGRLFSTMRIGEDDGINYICGVSTVLFEIEQPIIRKFYMFTFFRFKNGKRGNLYRKLQWKIMKWQ